MDTPPTRGERHLLTLLEDRRQELTDELARLTAPPEAGSNLSFGKRIGEGTTEAVERISTTATARSIAAAAQSGSGGGGVIPVVSPIGNAAQLSASVPGLSAKIVKTATISLQLPRRSFAARVQQATMVAARNGGFVADSQTTEGDHPSG